VTVKKEGLNGAAVPDIIDLGDRLIVYAESDKKLRNLMDGFSNLSSVLSVDKVGLEDAYLHLVNGGNITK
jgi:hypothetical protein